MKNEQLKMFMVSDAVNFDDIILETIARCFNDKQRHYFSGNVFHLAITEHYTIIQNLLETKPLCVVSTQTLQSAIQNQ